MKSIIFLCLMATVLISSAAFAAQTAKVLMVRGKVTALKPGSKKAIVVKKGMIFPEDTSIVTAAKAVVRVKFADKSTINLGPKSKVIVSKMPVKKPNMINLLTGAIKAEVNKKSKKLSANKMIIKTRSAVMGVRGTKFQTSFNPSNGNTSLVTVEGNVAMIKRKQAPPKVVTKTVTKMVEEDVKDEVTGEVTKQIVEEKVEVSQIEIVDELDELDKALETSKEVVEVPAGRFSGVTENSEKAPSAPTKIAPQQYEALAKSMHSDKKAIDVFTDKEIEEAASASADVAGAAPNAGGFVDFNTGLYVPPPKDAKKDEKTGVFIAKNIGKVDEETGSYIPPKGVILDAKKGFIVDQEEIAKVTSNEDKAALQKTLANLQGVNKEIKKQVVVNTIENKSSSSSTSWWKPNNQIFKVGISPYSETITTKNTTNNSEADFYTSKANLTEFSWQQDWNDKWSTKLAFGFVDYEIDDSEVNIRTDDGGGDYGSIGLAYKYSHNLTLSIDFTDKAYFLIYPESSGEIRVGSENLSYINLGINYFLLDWKAFHVYTGANLYMFEEAEIPGDQNGGATFINSSGFRMYMTGLFDWRDSMGVEGTGYFERTNHDSDDMEWTKTSVGTAVNFYYKI